MGGLVARAALMHAAGKRVSQLIMLGTPNAGSLAAVQALRGTYSVVRKIAMLDLRHDAEFLARNVFASFPGPARAAAGEQERQRPRPVRRGGVAGEGSRPGRRAAARGRRASSSAWRRRMRASHMVVGCNRTTATGVALRDGDFEYEYSLQGDGTVPIELARLAGARHSYVECGHSDMPLSDRVIAGTIDLLKTGATQRFAAAPPLQARLADARARRRAARAIPGQDRLAAHDAGAAAAVPRHAQRSAARPRASASAACRRRAAAHHSRRRRRRGQRARRGHGGCGTARRSRQRRRRGHRPAPGRRHRRLAAAPGG